MDVKLASAVVLLALLITAGCRPQPSPTVFLDPALAVLVPADTTLLIGIRMQHLQATPAYQQVRTSPRLRQFQTNTGLSDISDIWEYLIASNGSSWVALLRGKFTEMGMEPRVNKPNARRESYKGVSVIGDDKGSIAFLNPTTAIAGPQMAVLDALERRNNNSGIPEGLRKLAEAIPAENEAWFVSTGPLFGIASIERIRFGRGGFDPHSMALDVLIDAESEDDAKSIAQALNGHVNGTQVNARGQAPEHVLDWMLGRNNRQPVAP